MDFEDNTLYALYRAGHTGSQASPWRLPPSLAWLPWLLLPRAGSWTTSPCSSPTTPRRRRGVTPHRQQLLLLLSPCPFVDLVALLLFDNTLAPPYSERSPIWATLTTTTPRRWLLHLDSFTLHSYYTNGLPARRASPWLLSLDHRTHSAGSLQGLRLARALHLHRRCRRTESAPLPGPLSPYYRPLRCTTPWTTSRSVATVLRRRTVGEPHLGLSRSLPTAPLAALPARQVKSALAPPSRPAALPTIPAAMAQGLRPARALCLHHRCRGQGVCLGLGLSHHHHQPRARQPTAAARRRTYNRPYHWLRYQPGGL
jgi:hypothetical protein